jgi:hypothetical protein
MCNLNALSHVWDISQAGCGLFYFNNFMRLPSACEKSCPTFFSQQKKKIEQS